MTKLKEPRHIRLTDEMAKEEIERYRDRSFSEDNEVFKAGVRTGRIAEKKRIKILLRGLKDYIALMEIGLDKE